MILRLLPGASRGGRRITQLGKDDIILSMYKTFINNFLHWSGADKLQEHWTRACSSTRQSRKVCSHSRRFGDVIELLKTGEFIRRSASSESTPELAELRKQKHREAQARYRAKNAGNIRLKRFLCTKNGKEFKLGLLLQGGDDDCVVNSAPGKN